jgi:hypothetical protein
MGRIKDLFIDQINNQSPDDTDWNYNQLPPLPEEIDLNSGRGKWVFDDVEVWAYTYEQALELVPYIKD